MDIKRVLLMVGTTFLFTALFVPVVKKMANFIGALDMPNERKVHKVPIPRLGGLGIYAGFLLGYMLFGIHSVQMNAILIGSFIILVTGIFDDIKPVPAKWKLLAQTVGASIIPLYGGILLKDISAFGLYLNFGILAYPITIIFIVAIINCINLIDGLDGLSSGIASIYFLTIGIIAMLLNNSNGLDIILTFIMLGSTLGFLVHNFNPAKIFMGDTGSTFLGFMLATLSIQGVFKSYAVISFAVPLLILGLPLFDALFAMIRRILRGQSPMTADRGHLHHRLVDMGFSQKQTVFILYAISGVLGITAVLLAESGVLRALLLVICVLILLLIGSMLGKNSYVHQHQDNRNLTDDNEIDVEEVSDKKGNEDK